MSVKALTQFVQAVVKLNKAGFIVVQVATKRSDRG